jgi:hypothetical protein
MGSPKLNNAVRKSINWGCMNFNSVYFVAEKSFGRQALIGCPIFQMNATG